MSFNAIFLIISTIFYAFGCIKCHSLVFIKRFSVTLWYQWRKCEKKLPYILLYYCNKALATTSSYVYHVFENTEALTHIYMFTFPQRQRLLKLVVFQVKTSLFQHKIWVVCPPALFSVLQVWVHADLYFLSMMQTWWQCTTAREAHVKITICQDIVNKNKVPWIQLIHLKNTTQVINKVLIVFLFVF